MKELIQQLCNIPDAYDDFILGTINYAKKNPLYVNLLKDFIRNKSNLTSSDIISFIISQPDFHNYSATNRIILGEIYMKYLFSVSREIYGEKEIWVARSKNLKGCIGQGDTLIQAIIELQENEEGWLESAKEVGIPIPEVPD